MFKTMFLGLLTVVMMFSLTGCSASSGAKPGGFSLKSAANGPMIQKIEEPTNGNALIYVFRLYPPQALSKYFQETQKLYVNGKFVTDFREDGFYPLHVRPGHYVITINDADPKDCDDNKVIVGDVEAGKVYYAKAKIDTEDKGLSYGASFTSTNLSTDNKEAKDLIGTKLTSSKKEDIMALVGLKKELVENEISDDTKQAAAKGAAKGVFDTTDQTIKAAGDGVKLDSGGMAQAAGAGLIFGIIGNHITSQSDAYKDLIYKGIANYDMNYLFKDEEYFPDLKNPTRVQQIKHLTIYGFNIQYIENPDEELQLMAVKQNPESIKFIKNPTEKVKHLSQHMLKDYYLSKEDRENYAEIRVFNGYEGDRNSVISISDKFNSDLEIAKQNKKEVVSFYVDPGKVKLNFKSLFSRFDNQSLELDVLNNKQYCIKSGIKYGAFSSDFETVLVDNSECDKALGENALVTEKNKLIKENPEKRTSEYYSMNSDKREFATVYIYRESRFRLALRDFDIYLSNKYNDDLKLGELENGSIKSYKLDPGENKFRAAVGTPEKDDEYFSKNFQNGQSYCLKVEIVEGLWSLDFRLEEIDLSICKNEL